MGALHQDLKHTVTATDCHPLHGTQYMSYRDKSL